MQSKRVAHLVLTLAPPLDDGPSLLYNNDKRLALSLMLTCRDTCQLVSYLRAYDKAELTLAWAHGGLPKRTSPACASVMRQRLTLASAVNALSIPAVVRQS